MIEQIRKEAERATVQLCEAAGLKKRNIVIVGCSSSEIAGQRIGSYSSPEIGQAVFEGIFGVLREKGVFLAAQCCEHLNRAVIIERLALKDPQIVNAVPTPKAGGSFASAAYKAFRDPIAVEYIEADAGLDIGGTLIGMHLRRVAVPVRLESAVIGKASVLAARTRPKFVGGNRTLYDDVLM